MRNRRLRDFGVFGRRPPAGISSIAPKILVPFLRVPKQGVCNGDKSKPHQTRLRVAIISTTRAHHQSSTNCPNMLQFSTRSYTCEYMMQGPSTLASRDPNACPRFPLQMAAARRMEDEHSIYSHKRAHNPLFQRSPGKEQIRRRQIYLRQSKQAGDDKRWASRSEQVKQAARSRCLRPLH